MSGPLEVVMQNCTTYMLGGLTRKLDNAAKREIRAKAMVIHGTCRIASRSVHCVRFPRPITIVITTSPTGHGDFMMAFAQLPLGGSSYPSDFDFDFYMPNFPIVRPPRAAPAKTTSPR